MHKFYFVFGESDVVEIEVSGNGDILQDLADDAAAIIAVSHSGKFPTYEDVENDPNIRELDDIPTYFNLMVYHEGDANGFADGFYVGDASNGMCMYAQNRSAILHLEELSERSLYETLKEYAVVMVAAPNRSILIDCRGCRNNGLPQYRLRWSEREEDAIYVSVDQRRALFERIHSIIQWDVMENELNIQIPKTRFDEFCKELKNPNGQRIGQRFYDFMELHKVTSPANKDWADKLYNASDEAAKFMIKCRLNYDS